MSLKERFMRFASIISLWIALQLAIAGRTEDWPQFRGPSGTSVATTADIPSSWEAGQGIAWKLALPGQGWSQPITSGNLAFVTTAVSDQPLKPKGFLTGVMDPRSRPGSKATAPSIDLQWNLHAIDQKTGKELWKRTVVTGKPKYPIHPSNSFATETPATNGKHVFVYFGAIGTLACFENSGML
jgi:outer membrane protein assembly factor BamB